MPDTYDLPSSDMWFGYSDVLVLAGEYARAKPVCEHVLEVVEANTEAHPLDFLILSRVHMSLVLKELDVEHEAQKK